MNPKDTLESIFRKHHIGPVSDHFEIPVEFIIREAMQQHAIDFANWKDLNCDIIDNEVRYNGKFLTNAELYKIFKTTTPTND